MNTEQTMLQDIAELKANQVTLFKRVEKNENLITQIHKLTVTVETLASEMKKQNDKIDKIMDTLEDRMRAQGERIGELEKRGGKKLESIVTTVVTVLITAVVMYFAGRFGM